MSTYKFRLQSEKRKEELVIELPSVTTIIHGVLGRPMTPMAYWGFKLGVKAVVEALGDEALASADEIYAAAKEGAYAPNLVRDDAGRRGQQAHDTFEKLLLGKKPRIESNYDEAVVAAVEADDYGFFKSKKKLWIERPVVSLREGFAGRPDLVIFDKSDKNWILDLKTHEPPARWEDFLQLSAYALAVEEMTGKTINRVIVLFAKEDGTYEYSDEMIPDQDQFLLVRELYDAGSGWR